MILEIRLLGLGKVIIHQKIMTYIVENSVSLLLWGFKIQLKFNDFGNLIVWLWTRFGNFFEEFVRTLKKCLFPNLFFLYTFNQSKNIFY